ncbi:MAG: phytoene desaturase [Rubricella sp.]
MLTRTDLAERLAADEDDRPLAVVIGAGFGGLSAAIRLGAKGYRAVVLDRLDSVGGRGSAIRKNGYRFDLGPTIVTVPHLFEELWATAGRDFHADVDLRHLDPYYTIRFPDGSDFTVSSSREAVRAEVERLSPGEGRGYDRFMADAERRYQVGFVGLGRRPMHELAELIKVLPTFGWLRADTSIFQRAAKRFRDPRLQMAFSFHPLFIGGDPFHVTSMYALVSYLEAEFGVHYAMGGAEAIALGMVDVIEGQGGHIALQTEVDEITVEQGRATGVTLKDGSHLPAALVVSNADAGFTHTHLLRNHHSKKWTDEKLKGARWSMGLYVWYFGTKGTREKWPDIGHHTILNGPRYEGLCRDIFLDGHLSDDMSIYLHRPSVTDPTAAPEGGDAWYALSPVPHLGHENPVDWAAEETAYRRKVAAVLEQHIPGFEAHIEADHVLTPADFETRYLSPFGTGFSIEPRILQSAWFRPHNRSDAVDGLYLVGAGTHPGAGLPGVVASAEVVDKLIPRAAHVR